MTFENIALHPSVAEAIGYMGFKQPTPIQQQAIPAVLEGRDLIACAQTGTGKTAAFLIPMLDFMVRNRESKPQVLIVVPTRELALQIDQQIEGLGYSLDIFSVPIYGGDDGSSWDQQKKALTDGADIIVATPGKLISHLNQGYVNFSKIKFAVLDEADRMLDIGFYEDIVRIFSFLPATRQTLMFSATMPDKIRRLAKQILSHPFEISLSISKPAEGVLQSGYLVHDEQKIALIAHIIKNRPEFSSIVIFGSTRRSIKDIVNALRKEGMRARWISSDLEQNEREALMTDFRNRKIRILVATDVISRGIDVKDINMVINFTVPKDPEDYVHRVGRTARASTTGEAITLINKMEMRDFARIEQLIEREIDKVSPPELLGPGPEWNPQARFKSKNYGKSRKHKGKPRADAGKK